MSYQYNRNSFQSPGAPLLSVYSLLICIELFLKEKLPVGVVNSRNGHDVPTLLHLFGGTLPHPHRASLQALSVPLANSIGNLWSEGFSGHVKIPSRSYPYIRYLRHASEWGIPHSTDGDLQNLYSVAGQVKFQLIQATGVPF